MERQREILAKGEFEYYKTAFNVIIVIIFSILSITAIVFTIGYHTTRGLIFVYILMYPVIFLPLSAAAEKDKIAGSSLTIYNDVIVFISGGRKGSFYLPVNEIESCRIKFRILVINNKKAIPYCKNSKEIYDVIHSFIDNK